MNYKKEFQKKFDEQQSKSEEAYKYIAREYRKNKFETKADNYAIKRLNENRELLRWFNGEQINL